MRNMLKTAGVLALCIAGATACSNMPAGPQAMTFFVTSHGVGNGGDLGGLAGADQHCQSLATAAGAGDHVWHAYLSTQASKLDAPDFVNARDRIGTGPWQNAKGVVIAHSVEELHSAKNNVNKQNSLDENGQLRLSTSEQIELDEMRRDLEGPADREYLKIWWQERQRAARRVFNDPDQVQQIVTMLEASGA